ncbi:MAG: DinB family protein [Bacteroidota bacterium]
MPNNFKLEKSIALLERTPGTYRELCYGLGHNWTNINEGSDTWSAFDIVGHLIHGEQTDWIPRARIMLSNDGNKELEPFDRFAQKEISKGKTIEELIDQFSVLRKANLDILRSWHLTEEQLDRTAIHPDLGTVTLRQHLSTWTIHDMSHLYQLGRVIVKHYREDLGPWQAYSRILQENP